MEDLKVDQDKTKFVLIESNAYKKIMETTVDQSIKFFCGDLEVLRFEPNGSIFVQGRHAVTDLEVVEALRLWACTFSPGVPA